MAPVKFWDRDVDQARTRDVNTSGLAPSWDPENPPRDFDEARDDLLVGDMYSPEWPEPVRHPSKHLLETSAPHTPAQATRENDLLPFSPVPLPSQGGQLRLAAPAGASSDEKQPGRGHDQAA